MIRVYKQDSWYVIAVHESDAWPNRLYGLWDQIFLAMWRIRFRGDKGVQIAEVPKMTWKEFKRNYRGNE